MAFHTLGTVLKKSFSKYNSEIVQFGETGEKGIQPNYQLEVDNKKVTLNGKTMKNIFKINLMKTKYLFASVKLIF